MGSIRANGVWSADDGEPVELHVTSNILAASASNAIGGLGKKARQPVHFVAANQTEKRGIEGLFTLGLEPGDRVYLTDTLWYETWTTTGWRVTKTIVGIPYTPDWSISWLVPGTGVQNFRYWVDGDKITVQGILNFTDGSGGVGGGGGIYPKFPLPFPGLPGGTETGVLGQLHVSNYASGLTNTNFGVIYGEQEDIRFATGKASPYTLMAAQIREIDGEFNVYRGYRTPLEYNVPFMWDSAVTRRLSVLFSYTRA